MSAMNDHRRDRAILRIAKRRRELSERETVESEPEPLGGALMTYWDHSNTFGMAIQSGSQIFL
jgi:hypothetical protein